MATFKMVACSYYHSNLHERLAVAGIEASHIYIHVHKDYLKLYIQNRRIFPEKDLSTRYDQISRKWVRRFRVIESPTSFLPCILVVDLYSHS